MKTMLTARIMMIVFAIFAMVTATPGQITFVKAPQGSATSANRQTQQGGLSPEKKKNLSNYGPEDAFPGASEQENRQRQTNRTTPRRLVVTPSPTSTPAPTVTPTPASVPEIPTPGSISTAVATTNNTASVSTTSHTPNSQNSGLALFALATASLLVFGALVYVVRLLRKKIKETH